VYVWYKNRHLWTELRSKHVLTENYKQVYSSVIDMKSTMIKIIQCTDVRCNEVTFISR